MSQIPQNTTITNASRKLIHAARRRLLPFTIPRTIREVRKQGFTYLGEDALLDLQRQVLRVEEENIEGVLIEAGCALGGSAVVIASAKARERPFYVYDVFGMIPAPSERDESDVHERYAEIRRGEARGLAGNEYYGYLDDLLERVRQNFESFGVPAESNSVFLVPGLFQETLLVTAPVALAHIDGDWFESVMTCLERIEPHLSRGGVLVIDDYYAWSGCRKAVDEYFAGRQEEYAFIRKSRLHIVRK